MTRLSTVLLALLIAAIQPASAEWFTDYVVNGGFDEDANQDDAPDGWSASAYKSPATFAWDREVFHSGPASARLSDSFSEDHSNWDKQVAARRRDREGLGYQRLAPGHGPGHPSRGRGHPPAFLRHERWQRLRLVR